MPDPQALGTGRVGPLLLRFSLPAAIGMFVQASYTLVDAFFVGWGWALKGSPQSPWPSPFR